MLGVKDAFEIPIHYVSEAKSCFNSAGEALNVKLLSLLVLLMPTIFTLYELRNLNIKW